MYLAPLPPTKTDFCISLFEQVYLLSPRPSSLSAWNEIMRALSAENNQTRVCIHFSERAWMCMFHSSLVFLPRVVKWVTAVLVSLQVGTCGNVEGGGGWVDGWVSEWWGAYEYKVAGWNLLRCLGAREASPTGLRSDWEACRCKLKAGLCWEKFSLTFPG